MLDDANREDFVRGNRGERMTKGQIKRKEMIRSTFIYNKVKTKK